MKWKSLGLSVPERGDLGEDVQSRVLGQTRLGGDVGSQERAGEVSTHQQHAWTKRGGGPGRGRQFCLTEKHRAGRGRKRQG